MCVCNPNGSTSSNQYLYTSLAFSAKIVVACSKGTYIRSIAYDIGQKLQCGGHLVALERTKAGMFSVESAIKLEDIKSFEDAEKNIINPLEVLPQKKYNLNDSERERVLHGMSFPAKEKNISDNDIVFLVYGGKMIAVGIKTENEIKVKKVFEVL
jgi:tRNA pseudouridine55 synthase